MFCRQDGLGKCKVFSCCNKGCDSARQQHYAEEQHHLLGMCAGLAVFLCRTKEMGEDGRLV